MSFARRVGQKAALGAVFLVCNVATVHDNVHHSHPSQTLSIVILGGKRIAE
jgi:hypothetical protein